MKLAVDTNVLVRAVVQDDPVQARAASALLLQAELIPVAMASQCEFVWVLRRMSGFGALDTAAAISALPATANVQVDRPAAEAGLLTLEAAGDFADGVIAYEGNWLGGETFVSFDKKAVRLLAEQGLATRLL
jgi:predicted nucleic-acid-binding protein